MLDNSNCQAQKEKQRTPQEIKEAVYEMLKEHGMQNDVPVSLLKLAKALEYDCLFFDPAKNPGFKDVSGILNREKKKIYINDAENHKRQRFTIAHEIGHLRLHNESEIDYRTSINDPKNWKEYEANRFAAELLMPEAPFIEKWNKHQDLDIVASFFGVSIPAASIRAYSLGLL